MEQSTGNLSGKLILVDSDGNYDRFGCGAADIACLQQNLEMRQGLLSDTIVGPIGAIGVQADFPIGKTFIDTDINGDGVYSHTVTQEGWLRLGRVGGSECLISPAGPGFQEGAIVECPGFASRCVRVEDNVDKGLLRAWVNGSEETYHYDVDSGVLLP